MAEVLMIGGKPETIFNSRDFEYHVERLMGYEAAKYFRELVEELQADKERAEQAEDSDLHNYEASLDSNTRAFQDIQAEAARIMEQMQAPRINRKTIVHSVREIGRIINNQI